MAMMTTLSRCNEGSKSRNRVKEHITQRQTLSGAQPRDHTHCWYESYHKTQSRWCKGTVYLTFRLVPEIKCAETTKMSECPYKLRIGYTYLLIVGIQTATCGHFSNTRETTSIVMIHATEKHNTIERIEEESQSSDDESHCTYSKFDILGSSWNPLMMNPNNRRDSVHRSWIHYRIHLILLRIWW